MEYLRRRLSSRVNRFTGTWSCAWSRPSSRSSPSWPPPTAPSASPSTPPEGGRGGCGPTSCWCGSGRRAGPRAPPGGCCWGCTWGGPQHRPPPRPLRLRPPPLPVCPVGTAAAGTGPRGLSPGPTALLQPPPRTAGGPHLPHDGDAQPRPRRGGQGGRAYGVGPTEGGRDPERGRGLKWGGAHVGAWLSTLPAPRRSQGPHGGGQ
ncbi:uncharacterized protein WM294_017141 [Sarcoramphus papa]